MATFVGQLLVKRWLWRGVKAAIVVAILLGVGWTLTGNLKQLDTRDLSWDPAWLVLAGFLYLTGSLFCTWFWWWSLRSLGQRPGFFAILRAYYVGHLGKYVPGKALVPIIRTALIRGPQVHTGLAVVTVFYETLTVMAAGALLAVLLAGSWMGTEAQGLWILVVLAVAGLLASPWAVNPLMKWLVARALVARRPAIDSQPRSLGTRDYSSGHSAARSSSDAFSGLNAAATSACRSTMMHQMPRGMPRKQPRPEVHGIMARILPVMATR